MGEICFVVPRRCRSLRRAPTGSAARSVIHATLRRRSVGLYHKVVRPPFGNGHADQIAAIEVMYELRNIQMAPMLRRHPVLDHPAPFGRCRRRGIRLDPARIHRYSMAALRTHPVRGQGCAHLNLYFESTPPFFLPDGVRTSGVMNGGFHAQYQCIPHPRSRTSTQRSAAKELSKACTGDRKVIARFRSHHPRSAESTLDDSAAGPRETE